MRESFAGRIGVNFAQLRRSNLDFYRRAMSLESYMACFADQGYMAVGYGGMCIYRETPTPDNPTGICAYLMNVYTRPAVRAEGVRERIVNWLCDHARKRGVKKIYLTPRPDSALADEGYREEIV